MSRKNGSTREVPLEDYCDMVFEVAIKLGIERPAVVIILGDCTTGDVSTTSNLESCNELGLIKFVLRERLFGHYEVDTRKVKH
jgi:hypothetical protein